MSPADRVAPHRKPRRWLPWVSLALAVAAFLLDVRSGPSLFAEMVYILPPLLGFWSPTPKHAVLAGAEVTVLNLVALLLRADFSWGLLEDRGTGLAAVWIAVLLCVIHHRDLRALVSEKAIGQSYLDVADVLITVLDRDDTVILLNAKGCEILGVAPAAVAGHDGVDLYFPVGVRQEVRSGLRALASGELDSWRIESELANEAGEVRIIEWNWAVLRDEGGAASYRIGSGTDLTARRQAEASLLGQAALTRLGEMALMVAHEVKNPLAGLRGAIQALGNRLAADPEVTRVVARACRSIDGLTELIDDLFVFARPGLSVRDSVHVPPLLREVALLLEKDPERGGQVTVRGEDVRIAGDAGLLRQAFLNLLLNAVEAGGPRSKVAVDVERLDAGCRVLIHDEGPGIPLAIRARVFEPFFSTKGRGTGLGLAIAQRVAILHGGCIDVQCPPRGGTTMIVTLP